MSTGRSGVDGIRENDRALGRVPDDVAQDARAIDGTAGERMVAQMRADVAVDSGRLLNGITERQEGNATVVEATAIRGDFDYARIVEFGRHADASFFSSGGGEVAPEPFFYPAARDALSGREPAMDAAIGRAGQREGFR